MLSYEFPIISTLLILGKGSGRILPDFITLPFQSIQFRLIAGNLFHSIKANETEPGLRPLITLLRTSRLKYALEKVILDRGPSNGERSKCDFKKNTPDDLKHVKNDRFKNKKIHSGYSRKN